MKRILVDATNVSSKVTGAGVYALNILQIVQKIDKQNKYSVLVSDNFPESTLRQLNYDFIKINCGTIGLKREFVLSKFLMSRYVKNNFDIFYSFMPYLPLFCPMQSLITIHDLGFLRYKNFLKSKFHYIYFRNLISRSVRRAQKIFTVSNSTKQEINYFFKNNLDKIVITYAGSSFDFFDHSDILQASTIGRPYLLFVGERRQHKNLDGLIKGFSLYKKSHNDNLVLVLAGSDYKGYTHNLKKLIDENNIIDDVVIMDKPDDRELYALYDGCKALALVSFYEGFGIPLLEAMNSNKPILASNRYSLPEITDGAAYLVDPENVDEIAGGIDKIINDETLIDSLKVKGRDRATFFSWPKTGNIIVDTINAL